jgi:benzoate 4-monooxygenase
MGEGYREVCITLHNTSFHVLHLLTILTRQKSAFIPFSYGPRACVGRNVAEMELALIVSTVFRRYEFELYQDYMETREGFLRKPLGLRVGMRKRKA